MQDLSWFYSEGSGEAARLRRGPDGGLQQNWGHGEVGEGARKSLAELQKQQCASSVDLVWPAG